MNPKNKATKQNNTTRDATDIRSSPSAFGGNGKIVTTPDQQLLQSSEETNNIPDIASLCFRDNFLYEEWSDKKIRSVDVLRQLPCKLITN